MIRPAHSDHLHCGPSVWISAFWCLTLSLAEWVTVGSRTGWGVMSLCHYVTVALTTLLTWVGGAPVGVRVAAGGVVASAGLQQPGDVNWNVTFRLRGDWGAPRHSWDCSRGRSTERRRSLSPVTSLVRPRPGTWSVSEELNCELQSLPALALQDCKQSQISQEVKRVSQGTEMKMSAIRLSEAFIINQWVTETIKMVFM